MPERGEKGIRCKPEAASTYCKGDERTLIPLAGGPRRSARRMNLSQETCLESQLILRGK